MQPESFEPRPGPPPLPPRPLPATPQHGWPQPSPPAQRMSRWPLVAGGVIVVAVMLGVGGTLAVRYFGPPVARTRTPESAQDKYRAVREAFAATDPGGDPKARAAMDALMSQLGQALLKRQGQLAASMFDLERMQEEMAAHPAAPKLSRAEGGQFALGFQSTFAQTLGSPAGLEGWARHELRGVRPLPRAAGDDGDEAVLYVLHVLPDGTKMRFRWWVRRSGVGWRVYDYEELMEGLRVTTAMAVAASTTVPGRAGGFGGTNWINAFNDVQAAVSANGNGNFAAAEQSLRKVDHVAFPAEFEAIRWVSWGTAHLGQGRHAECLAALDKATAAVPGMPVTEMLRASAHLALDQHEQALASARRFGDTMGPDADNLHTIGVALEGLDRTGEALAAFRAGLDEDPDSADNLAALGAALPAAAKGEVSDRFLRSSMTPELFRAAAETFVGRDPVALRAVLDAYKSKAAAAAGADPYVAYYEARLHADADRHAEAAAIARAGLSTPDVEARELLRDVYLEAMAASGKALDAYRDQPAGASPAERGMTFLVLASRLQGTADDAGALPALVAARQAEAPDDGYAHYYDGWLKRQAGDFAGADRALADAAAAAGNLEASWDDVIREARIDVRYRLGQSLATLTDISPADKTFAQLASLYVADQDADGLAALIAARADAAPPPPSDVGWLLWRAELAWLRKDYGAAADLFLARNRAAEAAAYDDDQDEWGGYWPVGRRIVLSLIRAERDDEALRFAQGEKERNRGSESLLIVHASAGRAPEAIEAFRACIDEGADPFEMLYDDEDIGPLLRSDAFKALHAEYPPDAAPATQRAATQPAGTQSVEPEEGNVPASLK